MAKDSSSRSYISQGEFPRYSLEKALVIASALWDNFAGKGGAPHDIALALDKVPTSGDWRNLCGASIAYGLTEGGYNANEIILTSLGRKIVAPEDEDDDLLGKVEAIQNPRIMKEFFEKYNRAKFPAEQIAKNVLVSLGLPKDRTDMAYNTLIENGKYTGILKETKTGLFVALGSPSPAKIEVDQEISEEDNDKNSEQKDVKTLVEQFKTNDSGKEKEIKHLNNDNNKVFISHGKNLKIVNQLKELLTFGKFEPVISVERDTTSIPVPDKVFEDMRSCSAAVIHIQSEGEFLDTVGNKHLKINENVLIEIGAAMALYGKNFVLLVQKDLNLPSNLQGLYRCEYIGDTLDYEATMKLLKTFNEFRKK